MTLTGAFRTRRSFLRLMVMGCALGGGAGLLASCTPAPPTPTGAAVKPTVAPTAAAAPKVASPAVASSPAASPAAAASPASAAPGTKRPLDVVKRGNLRGITHGAAIAKARGYFQEAGIEDNETLFSTGVEQAQALATGGIEVGNSSNTSAFFNAVARGINQPFVCDNWHMEPKDNAYMVVLRPDLVNVIKTLPDLKGRINATSTPKKDGGSNFQARKMLEPQGLTLDDVQWEQLTFSNMLAALGSKSIDAAWIIEPFITLGKQRGLLTPWLNLGDYDPGFQIAGTIYSEKFIKERPDVARRWMLANVRGLRDYADFRKGKGRDVIGPILAKHTGLAPDVLDQVGWGPYDADGKLNVPSLMEAQKQLVEWGGVSQVLPAERIVDEQFIQYAARELGPYRG